jgi:hypothetical protein
MGFMDFGGAEIMSEIHVCTHHPANGKVFVDDDERGWKRVSAEEADPKKVIRCSWKRCKKPAVVLDHLYPYYIGANRCGRHEDYNKHPLGGE